jgi:hypothetical protein
MLPPTNMFHNVFTKQYFKEQTHLIFLIFWDNVLIA